MTRDELVKLARKEKASHIDESRQSIFKFSRNQQDHGWKRGQQNEQGLTCWYRWHYDQPPMTAEVI